MSDRADDPAPPIRDGDAELLAALLIEAIREEAADQALTLSTVSERAGLGDHLDRLAAGRAHWVEFRLTDVAAAARVLGVSASELVARAEVLLRKRSRQAPRRNG